MCLGICLWTKMCTFQEVKFFARAYLLKNCSGMVLILNVINWHHSPTVHLSWHCTDLVPWKLTLAVSCLLSWTLKLFISLYLSWLHALVDWAEYMQLSNPVLTAVTRLLSVYMLRSFPELPESYLNMKTNFLIRWIKTIIHLVDAKYHD